MESRRPDVVLLVSGAVVVLELKGRPEPEQADLDQAAAYARDLRCYHEHCAEREVHAVVVPTRAHGYAGVQRRRSYRGPDALHELVQDLQRPWAAGAFTADEFLARDAYCPLPTLVQAARELFLDGKIRPIHRARAATQPAIDEIARIAHEAAAHRFTTPRARHWRAWIGQDARRPQRSSQPRARRPGRRTRLGQANGAGDLSLWKRAAGAGAAIRAARRGRWRQDVRARRQELRQAVPWRQGSRASAARDRLRRGAARLGPGTGDRQASRVAAATSEPEAFVEFGERIPEWCVLVGLIGSGQEINMGEEAGLGQWRGALAQAGRPDGWTIHAPQRVLEEFFAGMMVTAAPFPLS